MATAASGSPRPTPRRRIAASWPASDSRPRSSPRFADAASDVVLWRPAPRPPPGRPPSNEGRRDPIDAVRERPPSPARSAAPRMSAEWGQLDRLTDLAATLAGAWGARARASTTLGQERAMLRLFGVHGLDTAGRPLAGEVVDRFVGGDSTRLGAGIAVPFAMALL